jgi:capsular polysaccharide transport system permease protein
MSFVARRPRVPVRPHTAIRRRASQVLLSPLRRIRGLWKTGFAPLLVSSAEHQMAESGDGQRSFTGLNLRRRLRAPIKPVIALPWPLILGGIVVLGSAFYFFGIGRNRYQVQSSFIVRLPETPASTGSSLLGATLAGPTMLGSLEDGRFLAVYLTSPEVMRRVFLRLNPEQTWARDGRDPFAGLAADANVNQQIEFFRRQVYVVPQDLTGVINLSTIGLAPEPSFQLNRLLLEEAELFLNKVNQNISATQQAFAEQEVQRARGRLDVASLALNRFKNQYGELDPAQAASGTNAYITALESKLVDLRVQEASLKRQFKDPSTPEVAYVTDQVRELEREIGEERARLVNPEGRDLNRLVADGSKLETEVLLATEALKSAITAANNSRQRTQQQVKFLVRLADPVLPEMQYLDWRWKGFLASLGGLVVLWGISSFVLGIADRR